MYDDDDDGDDDWQCIIIIIRRGLTQWSDAFTSLIISSPKAAIKKTQESFTEHKDSKEVFIN